MRVQGSKIVSGAERVPLGRAVVPIGFGDQVITSLLFNHDANPVHHKPEHAVQWLLGLLSGRALAGSDSALSQASPEERTYTLGAALLQHQDLVVMPGILLSAICFERFVPPEAWTVSVTTTFTHPLLVPTKGRVEVEIEAFELRVEPPAGSGLGPPRRLLIEARGPGLNGAPVKLLKIETLLYPAEGDIEAVFEQAVAPEFARLAKRAQAPPGQPDQLGLSHPAAISEEDRRRYGRMVGLERRITPLAWQAKIPRVLTEVMDYLAAHEGYMAEVKAYYAGREDEAERRRAIERYVRKEVHYRWLAEADIPRRIEELAGLTQQLYARQHIALDPRLFVEDGLAVKSATPFVLDLHLCEMRLRRGLHRFSTGLRLKDRQIFMGEATVTGQPLVTKELANFLCEINYSFNTLALFEYRNRR